MEQQNSFLRVDSAVMTSSPSSSYLADEVGSLCPLLTPSPPPNDLVNPPAEAESEQKRATFDIGDQLTTRLQRMDSGSSDSSAALRPDVQVANAAKEYCFADWNWPVIRRVCLWAFLAGTGACLAFVVAMVWTLPRACEPTVAWYQGNMFYEIFPASFQDTNEDGVGDIRGIISRVPYFTKIGAKAIRLNSIFPAPHYPEHYDTDISSLTALAPVLGSGPEEIVALASALHQAEVRLILDVPLKEPLLIDLVSGTDTVSAAILFWLDKGVDGFYLKNLENFAADPHLADSLRRWKRLVGPDRVIIVEAALLDSVESEGIVLSTVDLVDVMLQLDTGVESIRYQLETVQNSSLFSRPTTLWVHWSLGGVGVDRLASRLRHGNATLGAALLQLMLPGTVSVFYGDELGLFNHPGAEDLIHVHQLVTMVWADHQFSNRGILPWMVNLPNSANFAQRELIVKMVHLRQKSPAIYMNSVVHGAGLRANAEVKYAEHDLLVVQRWYPRRHPYVVVSNMGDKRIQADLSLIFYSGEVVVGPRPDSQNEDISFKSISLWPGESVVICLD